MTCSVIPAINPPFSRRPLTSSSNANLMCSCPFQLAQANLYAIRFVFDCLFLTRRMQHSIYRGNDDFSKLQGFFQLQFDSSGFDFQLPATVHAGMAIVVSPLLALIKDQVNALRARNVPCETINSSIPEAEKKRIRAVIFHLKPLLFAAFFRNWLRTFRTSSSSTSLQRG